MLYLDAYIEKCPGFAWEGAPMFATTVHRLRNKARRAEARWSQPQWRFTVPFNNTFPEHYQQVLDMQLVCRGRKNAFRVRNWLFYRADGWKFATGDGVTQRFKLGRLVEVAGESFLHEIHALSLAPDAPTPVAMVDGVPAAAAFNDRTGEVEFDNPPVEGAVLTWSGWFDFWVCFATDDFPASIDTKSPNGDFITNYTADLEEVPPPVEVWTP